MHNTGEPMNNTITPVKVRHLPAFLKACEPIATAIMDGDIQAALIHHADSLITATALGADVDRAWLEDQTADVLIDLAAQVMEVNVDFFVHILLPRINAAADRITNAMPTGGANGSAA
jgi:hypothetical protein